MGGVKYTRNKGGVTDGTPYFRMAKELQDIIAEEMGDAGADGVMEAREYIEAAGTGNEWSAPFTDRNGNKRSGPSGGRVDTGNMEHAVSFRIVHGKQVGLDLGWLDQSSEDDYFVAQDEGFTAGGYRPAKAVQGMHMISHMRMYMRGTVDDALDRITERIVNGL